MEYSIFFLVDLRYSEPNKLWFKIIQIQEAKRGPFRPSQVEEYLKCPTKVKIQKKIALFSCKAQLNKCTCVSVCPSVRLSVSKRNFASLWQLLIAYDSLNNLWQLMTADNSWWQLLTDFDSFWQLLTAFDSFWQLLTAFHSFWKIMTLVHEVACY